MDNKIELETFFQKSKGYYLEQYELYKNGHVLIFNLHAFIFNIFWYLFRKMYTEFFGLLLYFILQSIVVDYLILPQVSIRYQGIINLLITIFNSISIGFISNYLYFKRAERLILFSKNKYNNDNEKQLEYLKKKGGFSVIFIFVIILIIFVLKYLSESYY